MRHSNTQPPYPSHAQRSTTFAVNHATVLTTRASDPTQIKAAMAFIAPTALAHTRRSQPSSRASSSSSSSCSPMPRRQALLVLCASAAAALLPSTHVSSEEYLPAGAAQFSRVLAAQKQWDSLESVLQAGRTLDDSEWQNLRTLLRAIYQVSGDMEYIAKPWSADLKNSATQDIQKLRRTLKDMDQPAKERQLEEFSSKYHEVQNLFKSFFKTFSQASVGDVPDQI